MLLEPRPEIPDNFSSFWVKFHVLPILYCFRKIAIKFPYELQFLSSLYHREGKIEIYNFCEMNFFQIQVGNEPKTAVSVTVFKCCENSLEKARKFWFFNYFNIKILLIFSINSALFILIFTLSYGWMSSSLYLQILFQFFKEFANGIWWFQAHFNAL